MQRLIRARKNEKGFTLVELMVVVVIIGVLVAIAVPVFRNATDNANRKAAEANIRTINGAIMMHQANNLGTAPTIGNLEGDYIQEWPTGPDGVSYGIGGAGTQADPYAATITKGADTGTWFDSGNSWN